KTALKIRLPHQDSACGCPIKLPDVDQKPRERPLTAAEMRPYLEAIEHAASFPSPGGVVLSLPEPTVYHTADHRDCEGRFNDLRAVPREWTYDQLGILWNWLPAEAEAARSRLQAIQRRLDWRSLLEGWYCYAAAGVAGLVLTRYGTIR